MNRIGQLKHVTVWLVLLGFLCGMMGPSDSFAKVDRKIDTEGDPGDGADREGGSGGSNDFLLESIVWPDFDFEEIEITLRLVQIDLNGTVVFEIEFVSLESRR